MEKPEISCEDWKQEVDWEDWDTCRASFDPEPEIGKTYQLTVHTFNGWNLNHLETLPVVEITIHSSYIARGGWKKFNAFLRGKECAVSEPAFHTATIANVPHNTLKRGD